MEGMIRPAEAEGQGIVVALGGNALMQPGERGTAAEQRANLAATFRAIQQSFYGELPERPNAPLFGGAASPLRSNLPVPAML